MRGVTARRASGQRARFRFAIELIGEQRTEVVQVEDFLWQRTRALPDPRTTRVAKHGLANERRCLLIFITAEGKKQVIVVRAVVEVVASQATFLVKPLAEAASHLVDVELRGLHVELAEVPVPEDLIDEEHCAFDNQPAPQV